ncbi:hypothetical protein SAMN05414137_114226 [Streptacidiphilus jiangxiensis]|uniref:Uncharacterized protein n=2 Tax=Streptacidiphilus jiangxiensis TaxID=235985 RepID=A0A1H7TV86_STRJI|nr:hypothetical protein SAMN05414137_114226 [Streptacidiphilus jiangxiensis]
MSLVAVGPSADPSLFLSTLAGTLAVCFTIGFAGLGIVLGGDLPTGARTKLIVFVLSAVDLSAVAAPLLLLWALGTAHPFFTPTAGWVDACSLGVAAVAAANVVLLAVFAVLPSTRERVVKAWSFLRAPSERELPDRIAGSLRVLAEHRAATAVPPQANGGVALTDRELLVELLKAVTVLVEHLPAEPTTDRAAHE